MAQSFPALYLRGFGRLFGFQSTYRIPAYMAALIESPYQEQRV